MNHPDGRLMVFAKAPVPGRVKTRLIPSLGASDAAALHERMVLRTLSLAIDARVGPVDLWCTPSSRHPFFTECARRFPISLLTQEGEDLGQRMSHAFHQTLQMASRALLIGTDCPSLAVGDLERASDVLRQGTQAVLGPTEDGGYFLIGLRKTVPELFADIPWGTETVLHQTRCRLQKMKWTWYELPERWDVDRPEDVERLRRAGPFLQIP